MSVLSAQSILKYAERGRELISPHHPRTVENGMTYGLGPAGYDIRCAEGISIPPGAFRLGSSFERFDIPLDLIAYVKDKSSWARKGLCVQNTVIEPGWMGFLTLEYTNHSNGYIHLREKDPIAQIIFHRLDAPTILPYKGKYQDQPAGPQHAIEEKKPG